MYAKIMVFDAKTTDSARVVRKDNELLAKIT